ncbi:MAG TPA: hypothetical protein VFT62_07265, partial [Mycobacteriales bacterium]|nr:hypothetical protein [Mycobacteriales bacterium]
PHQAGPSSAATAHAVRPAPPAAPLEVTATGPHTAYVGQPVSFTVRWRDGAGAFVGSSQSWGDDSGLGASRYVRCHGGQTAGDGPHSGSSTESHTYQAAGTYTVVLAVVTAGCHASSEQSAATLRLTVLPAPASSASPSPSSSASATAGAGSDPAASPVPSTGVG